MFNKTKKSLERLVTGTMILGAVTFFPGCRTIPKQPPTSSIYFQKDFDISNMTEANKFLLDFPERLPGAKRIDKYPIQGAVKTIVFIRQDHYEKDLTKKELKAVEKNHYNIYLSLSHLIEHNGLEYVYDEWFTKYDVDDNGMPIQIKNMIRDMNTYDKNTRAYKFNKKMFDRRMAYCATEKLAAEGKLKIKPSETFEGYHWGTMDKREDIALEFLSKDEEIWLVLLFGYSHDPLGEDSYGTNYSLRRRKSKKDNVAVWNKANPDKMFSVIEVESNGTPSPWEDE